MAKDSAGVPDRSGGAGAPAPGGEPGDPIPRTAYFDEERCRALMRVLTSIVWTADGEGRFTSPQPSWTAYTGQSWLEQQGHGWMKAVHPDDREQIASRLDEARRRRDLYQVGARLWHASSHAYRHVEARGVPIVDPAGAVVEWVGTCRDVEESKRAEEVLRTADRRKDEFIAILAHELRNPLAPIRNAVQVLKLRGGGDMQLAWARAVIERQVAQMSHILEDLLDVSRISQHKLELHKTRVTLDSVLDAAIEGCRPLCEQHGHHLEVSALSGPIYLDADAPRLIQAFTNLLNNAVKYTDRGGRITLTVRRERAVAVVEIEDTGIGLRPEVLPRLFDLFTQDQPALERSQGGLGIGLSIVKALVEMHGGTVHAESEGAGLGSRFVVRLPSADRRASSRVPAGASGAAVRRLKILVADDNADAAETLSVLLELSGHDVRLAGDGEEALRVARVFRPDLALLDIGMPKLNGYQVAAALKSAAVGEAGPVLVAVTGWGQREDVRRALESGFDHHMVKPVDPERLMAFIGGGAAAGRAP